MKTEHIFLGVAILAEVIATSFLKASVGFTRPWPTVAMFVGYGVSLYFLSVTLNSIPTGLAYAIWSGLGIVLISTISWLIFGQSLDGAALLGMAPIIAGVAVINLYSESGVH